MKTRLVILISIAIISIIAISILYIPYTEVDINTYNTQNEMRRTDQINKSPYAVFGDSSQTLMTNHEQTSNHTLEISNRYNNENIGRLELNTQTGKISLYDRKGNLLSETLLHSGQLTRFVSVDRFAEKYHYLSPYQYAANNPIKNVDINGDSIWVYYGNNQRVQYTPGANYDGNDFVNTVFQYLNQMNGSEVGNAILSKLSKSDNNFDYKNSFAKDNKGNIMKNTLSFQANQDGGGTIHAGFLTEKQSSNIRANDFNKLRSLAHESFHGFQSEYGEFGLESYMEVSAELAERAVVGHSWQYGNGKGTQADEIYQNSMTNLEFSTTFNQTYFNNATQNFLEGSYLNSSRIYSNAGYQSNLRNNPCISILFPILK